MYDFIVWIFESFEVLILTLTGQTIYSIEGATGISLYEIDVNLSLFSETPIITTDLLILFNLFFATFYTVIFIVIVWKIIKKVVVKITGWKKW